MDNHTIDPTEAAISAYLQKLQDLKDALNAFAAAQKAKSAQLQAMLLRAYGGAK